MIGLSDSPDSRIIRAVNLHFRLCGCRLQDLARNQHTTYGFMIQVGHQPFLATRLHPPTHSISNAALPRLACSWRQKPRCCNTLAKHLGCMLSSASLWQGGSRTWCFARESKDADVQQTAWPGNGKNLDSEEGSDTVAVDASTIYEHLT